MLYSELLAQEMQELARLQNIDPWRFFTPRTQMLEEQGRLIQRIKDHIAEFGDTEE